MSTTTKSPRDVVIVGAARTAIGRGKRPSGVYSEVHPSTLLAHVYSAVLERAGVAPARSTRSSRARSRRSASSRTTSGAAPGCRPATQSRCRRPRSTCSVGPRSRRSTLRPPRSRPASTTSSSQLASSTWGACRWAANVPADLSSLPYTPELLERYALTPQGLSAELIAERWGLERAELDAFGVRSQELARAPPTRACSTARSLRSR